jgi:acyl carrier protein
MKELDMSNKEKYDNVFLESFSISREMLNEHFVYQCIPAWDSVGHMGMIAGLEEVFEIMMETDDIIEFGSYIIGMEKLRKYGIEI